MTCSDNAVFLLLCSSVSLAHLPFYDLHLWGHFGFRAECLVSWLHHLLANGFLGQLFNLLSVSSVQSLSHVQLCNTMDCCSPGLPIPHQLLEFTQTHVHWVGDVIQPSHPLSSPSLLAFSLSQHQDLFQWVSSSHQVAKVLEFQL